MFKRIGFDARLINESGIGRYIRNLLSNISLIDKKNKYFILLKKADYSKFNFGDNFKNIEADFGWYSVSEQINLPKILNDLNLDLVHFPHFNVPIFFNGKFIVTIHDLIHQHFAMKRATTLDPLTYRIKQIGYNKVFRNAVKNSQKILVPSEFVKNQLLDEWQVNNEKIIVTYEGVDEKILAIKKKQSKSLQLKILEKIGVKKPYVFYIGNAHPHKNIESLIKGFRKIRESYPDLNLVLAGGDHYFWKRIKQEYTEPGIIYPGYVTDESLVTLFSHAEMFVMPSFEEGFGIPVLESFANRCPVVCSDIGALKEVGAEACLYFNSKSINDLVSKVLQVLKDNKLKEKLVKKGERRVKLFSWRKLAQETLTVYKLAS